MTCKIKNDLQKYAGSIENTTFYRVLYYLY